MSQEAVAAMQEAVAAADNATGAARALRRVAALYPPEYQGERDSFRWAAEQALRALYPDGAKGVAWAVCDAAWSAPWNGAAAPSGAGRDGTDTGAAIHLRPYSDVRPEHAEWVWRGRVPRAAQSLLVGPPGLGKTMLGVRLAAGVSRGELGGEPGHAIYATAEDSPAHTLAPRLIAAGADLALVHDVRLTRDGVEVGLTLPDDVELLAGVVADLDARLLVVDPVFAHLGSGIDSHRDHSIRRALAPLYRLADETGCAVLGIGHLNKSAGSDLFARVGGSIGLTGAARSILLMAQDPEAPEDDRARVLVHGKCNLAPLAPTLRLRVEPARVETEDGPLATARVEIGDEAAHLRAGDVLAAPEGEERSAREEAEEYLREALAEGPRPAEDVMRECERRTGASRRTIERARRALGVVSEPDRDLGGKLRGWLIRLPDRHTSESGGLVPARGPESLAPQGDTADSTSPPLTRPPREGGGLVEQPGEGPELDYGADLDRALGGAA